MLSPCIRQVTHALLTRPPLRYIFLQTNPHSNISPFDLHVLGTPPAFILSQDRTLVFKSLTWWGPFEPGKNLLGSAWWGPFEPSGEKFPFWVPSQDQPGPFPSLLLLCLVIVLFSFSLNFPLFQALRLFLESSGSHCCLFVKVLPASPGTALIYYHAFFSLSRPFLEFFYK